MCSGFLVKALLCSAWHELLFFHQSRVPLKTECMVHIYIYIYIYRERERENIYIYREREREREKTSLEATLKYGMRLD
jgi:hypothetical protein